MNAAVELLSNQMQGAYEMLRARLDGLTEDEFFWAPTPDAWTAPIPASLA